MHPKTTKCAPKNYLKIIILITFYGIALHSQARILEWKPQIPSSVAPFQNSPQALADMTGNTILIYAHPAQSISFPTMKYGQKISGKYYSAAVVVPASSKSVARLLQNYANYPGLFPTLKRAKVLEQNGSAARVSYSVHIPTPIPVLNFHETVTMQHQIEGSSISSLVLNAPVQYGAGKMEWFELGPNETLITLTQWGDLNQPKGFLFSTILSALPDAKLGIPSGTNGFILESLQRRFKSSAAQPMHTPLPAFSLSEQHIQQVAQISQNSHEPVSFILPAQKVQYSHGNEVMRFSTSYQYYPQNPGKLQPWLAAPAFQQLFPRQVKALSIQNISTQQLDARYKVSVGLGVINIPFNFKMRFDYPDSLQNRFRATGGDLKFVRGGMSLTPFKQGSLLNVTSALKIDDDAPLLLRAMRSMPYADMLPAVGGNTVFALKVKQQLR